MRKATCLAALLLVGCGGNNPPPPPPVLVTLSGDIVGRPWDNSLGSKGVLPMQGAAFDFPVCSVATQCGVGYVRANVGYATIATAKQLSMSYTITGNSPVFDFHTEASNTCTGPPAGVRLLIEHYADTLFVNTWRLFSRDAPELALGTNTLTVALDPTLWGDVYAQQASDFGNTLANVGWLGFTLGGGCFWPHGVAVTSGTARFTVQKYEIN